MVICQLPESLHPMVGIAMLSFYGEEPMVAKLMLMLMLMVAASTEGKGGKAAKEAKEPKVITVKANDVFRMDDRIEHAFTIYEPRSWRNDWDIVACHVSESDKNYRLYTWKPDAKDEKFLVEDKNSYRPLYYALRKKLYIDVPHIADGATSVTFDVQKYGSPVTKQVVGECYGREVSANEIYFDNEFTLSLKWDEEAQVCRWRAKSTLKRRWEAFGMPSRVIIEREDYWRATRPFWGEETYRVGFYDVDAFWLGERAFPVTTNKSERSGWFGDEQARFICTRTGKIEVTVEPPEKNKESGD